MVAIVTTMTAKLFRKMSPKTVAFTAIGLTIILCVYYASYTTDVNQRTASQQQQQDNSKIIDDNSIDNNNYGVNEELRQPRFSKLVSNNNINNNNNNNNSNYRSFIRKDYEICPRLTNTEADVNTVEVFKDFDFQPPWMKTREYWDKSFEDRYERQKMDAERPPLKVIIIPHSHNDPGWLKTFENYYHYSSRQIINLMVSKLQQHKNFTFIWSEIAFLNAWWEEAHPSKQRALKNLVNAGRVEITTGGWVMTDEANAHIYAMVDQLIEGHQWVWTNLGVKPRSGWSIDPFGHGSTQPYLLALSGINGTIIQRIHYAWKQWLAMKQYGDFRWIPSWSPADQQSSILTHNQPFDIYSIKHSCGPHPYICLNFDFRKVQGEYTEYSIKAQTITDKNIKEKSELLLEQYARTGSLFPHNVVLMPLGDDFRYNVMEEWDQQYTNYKKLINYINENKDKYKTDIMFGTPKDYFNEIIKRYDQFPTLKGDFFVYSDIFSEGRPAYWSGYFTTRPFMKILNRELENTLRSTEILYTLALNYVRQQKSTMHLKNLERDYEKLIKSRRNLGLFQHHDAITGTSKSFVMRDYGLKLFESIRDTINIQKDAIQSLLLPKLTIKSDENILLADYERYAFEQLPKKIPINISKEQSTRKIIVYNSLAQPQDELIKIRVTTNNVKVIDDDSNVEIPSQINPVWDSNATNTKFTIAKDEYELTFVIKLQQLTIKILTITYDESSDGKLSTIYCNKCHRQHMETANNSSNSGGVILESKFQIKNIPIGDIQLENHKFKLLFNGDSGFLKTITRKIKPKIMQCGIQFAAYRSAQFHSGSYLFMPDPNEHDVEKDVLQQYKDQMSIIITSGQISSEITVIYGQFLIHSITIYHMENSQLSDGISIENIVDFESPPKNRETELFMRFITDIQNGEPPEFYTDLNGFQIQKRIKVDKIGIEGNYFPITTMAFIQDDQIRLSLLTNHAQGAASWQPGYLEIMIDRRTLYDDSRGMGEGVVDNRKTIHKHWLIIEDIDNSDNSNNNNNNKKEQAKRFENSDDNPPFEKGEVLRSINIPTESNINNNNNNNNNNKNEIFPLPSLYVNQLSNILNYPMFTYIVDQKYQDLVKNKSISLLNDQLPCDLHLLTLRTQPDWIYSQFPSNSALLVLHRQNYDCAVNKQFQCNRKQFMKNCNFEFVNINNIEMKTLTGIETIYYNLTSLSDIYVEPMTLKTFNITFVL